MAFRTTDTDTGYLQTNLCTKLNRQRKGAPGAHSTTMVRLSTDKDKAKEVLNHIVNVTTRSRVNITT